MSCCHCGRRNSEKRLGVGRHRSIISLFGSYRSINELLSCLVLRDNWFDSNQHSRRTPAPLLGFFFCFFFFLSVCLSVCPSVCLSVVVVCVCGKRGDWFWFLSFLLLSCWGNAFIELIQFISNWGFFCVFHGTVAHRPESWPCFIFDFVDFVDFVAAVVAVAVVAVLYWQ